MSRERARTAACVLACLAGAAVALAAPAPLPRHKRAEDAGQRVARMMESYRTRIPQAEGMAEENGLSIRELEPYLMSHLAGVARRMKVRTRAECLALMPYLKDRDCKLRFIASLAVNEATNAWPGGLSVTCFRDVNSPEHERMVRDFEARLGRLDP